jgi:hypothetical protein
MRSFKNQNDSDALSSFVDATRKVGVKFDAVTRNTSNQCTANGSRLTTLTYCDCVDNFSHNYVNLMKTDLTTGETTALRPSWHRLSAHRSCRMSGLHT